MSKINLFRSAFANSYDTISVHRRITIKKALPDIDLDNSIIAVNGFQTDKNHVLQKNDVCTIRIFPKDKPGGDPLSWVLGIATLGVYTAVDSIYAHFNGGHSMIQDAVLSMIPEPEKSQTNSPDSLTPIPQLKGAKNQSNKGKPIPLVMGKHLYTPMYIGSPYTTIDGADGEDQYFNALYLLGWGKLKVTDIKLGPVSGLAKNASGVTDGILLYDKDDKFCDPSFADSNPQLELRQGAREVDLYPQKVVEEQLSIELINVEGKVNNTPRFSAKNPEKIQIEITFPNGLISYNDKGKKQNASVGISAQWRKNGEEAWREFGRFGTDGGQSPTSYNSATRTTTITRQEAKVKRFVAERRFAYAEVKDAVDRTLELRIVRETAQPADTGRTADTVYLSAIRTWCFDNEATKANGGEMVLQVPMIENYRNQTARLGFRIKATDNLQGTINALNCMVESYARTWDGSSWDGPEKPTNNTASIALKILQSPALGSNAYPDDMLDLEGTFADFYEWCRAKGFSCNGVLTAEKRVDDLLNAVLSTGRAMRILDGNRYAILIDKPRENPVMIVNSQNVLKVDNQKAFEDRPDGYSIKFVNEMDGYQETEVTVMADGSAKPGPASKIESVEMPFVTDHEQAVKNGWYQLACRQLRPEIWRRTLSIDGYLIGIEDRVEVQDDTIAVGLGEGAAVTGITFENGYIKDIKTDGYFDVSDMSKSYGIKIVHFDGISNEPIIRTLQVHIPEPGLYRNFSFTPAINISPAPQPGDLVAFGEYEKITTPALCFGKKDNGDGTFELTFLPYQEGIYTADEDKEIPEYEANITTPQQTVSVPVTPAYIDDMNDRISEAQAEAAAKKYKDFRFAKSGSTSETPPIATDEDNPGDNWTDAPPSIADTEYLWMTETEWNGEVRMRSWSAPVRLSGLVVPSYTWIRYADDIHGNGISNDPAGKTYIGFAYNKPAPNETNTPGDYQWSLIKGEDGVNGTDGVNGLPGAPGKDGKTTYTWIKYSDYSDGTGLYPLPNNNTKYIGIAVNKDTAAESNTKTDYIWSLFKGADGVPGTNGTNGVNGKDGKGISSSAVTYQASTSGTVTPTGTWSAAIPSVAAGSYLWTRTVVTYSDSTTSTSYSVARQGANGTNGTNGAPGKDGSLAPKYIGKTYHPSSTNSVSVLVNPTDKNKDYYSSVRANVGDWVAYGGASSGIWIKDCCMRWNGTQWVQVDSLDSRNSGAYMEALADILADTTATSKFKTSFIKNLFAQIINAEVINVLMKLLVGSGTSGILIDGVNKLIKSMDYVSGKSGFIMKQTKDANGIQAEFTDMKISKNLDANIKFKGVNYEVPLIGGVRAYLEFSLSNSNFTIIKQSMPFQLSYYFDGFVSCSVSGSNETNFLQNCEVVGHATSFANKPLLFGIATQQISGGKLIGFQFYDMNGVKTAPNHAKLYLIG